MRKFGILTVLVWGTSAASFAQVSSEVRSRESFLQPMTTTIEIKPIPLAVSTIPNIGAIGLGAETSAGSNIAVFGQASFINANLPNKFRNQENEDTVPQVHKMTGYAGDLGARWYAANMTLDSWYTGAKVGYTYTRGQWGYKDEVVDSSQRAITPGLEGGYRWVWPSSVAVRLGAGADGNIVQENNVTVADDSDVNAATNDAQEKIKGYGKVAVIPRVDLGLGYIF